MSTDNRSVLVLLVASNAESWLPDVIEGVRNQTHDEIEILAVDNASTDRSRALLEKAFGASNVVSLDRRVGYGRALAAGLKVASERGTAHDAFLLLHDDAAMDPETVDAMLQALERERVGIVGAKLVEWDEPERLQEVGLTTDRFGRLFDPLERGELDQGQHDGLKEVFFSSSACLLVGRDVIERVGLFDLRYVALRDDFDLSWRARIAGFRSVVTTDARVRHAAASSRGDRPGPLAGRNRYFTERNMIASLLKNYSLPHLIVALPVTLAVSFMNVVLYLVGGRRIAARQTLAALQWNLVHLPSTLRARARAQRRRKVPDREVVKLMVRGAPRVRSYVERALEQVVGEPAEGIDEEEGAISERSPRRLIDAVAAHPLPIISTILVIAYLIGARHLYGSGGLAGADLAPFPRGPGAFFTEFFSGWRSAGTGGAAPASPSLFLGGLLSIVSFGSARLAERILILALLPLAGAAASKLGAAVGMPPAPRRVMAIAYALSPLALASFSQGRLPDLVLVAALPALIVPPLRAGGLA
ncbi:MAG: glycosyltransferase family 2 protein, partial [Actinomycetota bacterium]